MKNSAAIPQLRQRRPGGLPLAGVTALLALALGACGPTSSYELTWSLGGEAVKSAKDCSRSGVDGVEVTARRDSDEVRMVFSCYSVEDGASGKGPDLSSGTWALGVAPLSAAGLRLGAEVVVQAEVPSEGYVAVSVDVPRPPGCADGVDNDGDGTVDAFDPQCVDDQGVYDPQRSETSP